MPVGQDGRLLAVSSPSNATSQMYRCSTIGNISVPEAFQNCLRACQQRLFQRVTMGGIIHVPFQFLEVYVRHKLKDESKIF